MLYYNKLRVSLLVVPNFSRYILEKICIKKGIVMISEEYYLDFLKCIISCVNNGDYYSIKELSVLELEKLKKKCISDKSNSKMLK